MKKILISAALLVFSAGLLGACNNNKQEEDKGYTYIVNEEDTALYTVQGGYFTPNIDETTNFTATTKVNLVIEGEDYVLTKVFENTEVGAASLQAKAKERGWEYKPVKFEYTFKGKVEKGTEEGVYTLKAATWGEGYQDWGTFALAGVEENVEKVSSEQDESVLEYFSTPYIREAGNDDQEVKINEANKSFEYLDIVVSW